MIKFLVIRFSSIGDIVLTSPVVRCLKKQVNESEIHFLTKKEFEPLVAGNPYISKVHVLDNNMSALIDELKNEMFDYVIDLHHNLRTSKIKRALKLASFSYPKLNVEKWLMVNFKINKLPDIHIVDRYFSTLSVFDVENDMLGLEYFISEKDEVSPSDYNPALSGKFISFVIGAKHFTKQLPVEKIARICSRLNSPVVLLGGKDDMAKASEIVSNSGSNVIDMTGKLSLSQSASFVRQSHMVITHDTGLMHIAAAFRKNIISVWGNTVPAFGMYPYQPGEDSKIVEVAGLSCRPCTKIGFKTCPKKHFRCMNDIDEEIIVTFAAGLMEK